MPVNAKNGQTDLIPISGRVPVLNLEFAHGQSGFQPIAANLPKGTHGSGGVLGGFFGYKMQKKNPAKKSNRRKIRQPKTKNPPAHSPPENHQPGPKIRWEPTNKSACQTSKYTPVFFVDWKLALGDVCRAWILGHLFGSLLGMVEAPIWRLQMPWIIALWGS